MKELHLKAGLFVFAVVATTIIAIWTGSVVVGSLIILAFLTVFPGAVQDTSKALLSLKKLWSQNDEG